MWGHWQRGGFAALVKSIKHIPRIEPAHNFAKPNVRHTLYSKARILHDYEQSPLAATHESKCMMKKTIMVVEDYDDIRSMMKVMIELYGYDVVLARNGSEAVAQAKQLHPDMILMDLSMPIMDGLTATKLIRQADDKLASIPIVALTGHGKSHAKQAYESGCDRVLQKPVNFNVLKPMLRSFLK